MKHSKVSAETRDKSIKDADLGAGAWALKAVRAVSSLRGRRSGSFRSGEVAYRAAQMLVGLLAFLTVKAAFGVPMNFAAFLAMVGVLVGSQFGAVRFLVFSLVYWGVVGTAMGLSPLAAWPLSPSWWRGAAAAFQGEQTGLWPTVAAFLLAGVVWVAAGRLAARGMGRKFVALVEDWTFTRSQEAQKRHEEEVDEEFEKVGVTRSEVDDLSRRNESDRRRAIVFGGGTRRRRAEGPAVSLAKSEDAPARAATESAQRVADLAGRVEGDDARFLAGMTSGPDLGSMLGDEPSTAAPSPRPAAAADEDLDDIPGPSANRHRTASEPEDDVPGPSDASGASTATAVMEVVETVEPALPAVSAPRINPEASRGRRRKSREDLGKMIDLFNAMSREDNLRLFVNATKVKLIRLTDEDYEELRALEGGDVLITLSQDLKRGDQSRGRTAVAERQDLFDDFMTGSDSTMPTRETSGGPSTAGGDLVKALGLVHSAASGRASLGAAPVLATTPPSDAEPEDFEGDAAASVPETPAPGGSVRAAEATSADRSHGISATTSRGESVSFDVDITDSESNDPAMRRYPTPYASARVSILNHSGLSDDQKVDRLRALDRDQGASTVDMFAGDDVAMLLNLPPKIMASLREKVVRLLGEKPSDMDALQALFDRRVDLVQKDMFQRPHEYQRILGSFMTAGADIQDLVARVDTPQAREVLEHSMRLDPWFEQNLSGLRSGKLKAALPLPPRGPGVLDRFSGTVDAALRGAGFSAREAQASVPAAHGADRNGPPASEAVIDVAPVRVDAPPVPSSVPAEPVRRFQKGVDAQWTPDAQPGSEAYAAEMAEHFSMIVRRNGDRAEQSRREEEEARLRREREESEERAREDREREEQRRRDEEARLQRRQEEFFASLPRSEASHFVKSIPARFMGEDILSSIAGILEGNALASRMRHEHARQKMAFVQQWEADRRSQPDSVEELSAPGEKLQAEVGVRGGVLARALLGQVAAACGLSDDASFDEISGRLADDEEREFARWIDRIAVRGDELRGLLEAADRRERAAIAEAAREEAQRLFSPPAGGGDEERVHRLETDLEERGREAQRLREEAAAAVERAEAAERAAEERTVAAAAALRAAEEMQGRVRELEARAAVGEGDSVDAGSDDPAARVAAYLEEHLNRLDVKTDLRAYTARLETEIMVVVDLPDEAASANVLIVAGKEIPLVDVLNRFVMRAAAAVDPLLDVTKMLLVTNAEVPSEVSALALAVPELEVCPRETQTVFRSLRGYGLVLR
jgi:hypothetical protein